MIEQLELHEYEQMQAKNFGLPIVSEEFLDNFANDSNQDLNYSVLRYNIADWITKEANPTYINIDYSIMFHVHLKLHIYGNSKLLYIESIINK